VTCEAALVDPFIPLAADPPVTPRDHVEGLVWTIAGTPEVLYWDGFDEVHVGCAEGGTIVMSDVDGTWRKRVVLTDCELTPGTALSGSGEIDLIDLGADLSLSGNRGELELEAGADGHRLTGTWDDRPVLASW
jgi:hypothetical protein